LPHLVPVIFKDLLHIALTGELPAVSLGNVSRVSRLLYPSIDLAIPKPLSFIEQRPSNVSMHDGFPQDSGSSYLSEISATPDLKQAGF
jgi:hypothetical protein